MRSFLGLFPYEDVLAVKLKTQPEAASGELGQHIYNPTAFPRCGEPQAVLGIGWEIINRFKKAIIHIIRYAWFSFFKFHFR